MSNPVKWRESVKSPFVTPKEVAAYIRVSREAVYKLIARGVLPTPIRIGRKIFYRREELDEWLESKRTVSEKG
jgi:excisionase family DNA binding protein